MQQNQISRLRLLAFAALFAAACAAPSTGQPDPEIARILDRFDGNRDGVLARDEVPSEDRLRFDRFDENGDGFVDADELARSLPDSDEPIAAFEVDGRVAQMNGVIDGSLPDTVRTLLREHPEVERIDMIDVPGSMDDEANLEAARLLHDSGIATHVPAHGTIASGGVDFYLAGMRRTAEEGARFGVHSWGHDSYQGKDVPRDDPQHALYLDFYRAIDIPASFYWFTLEAAPAEGIHWMSADEMTQHQVLTEPLQQAALDTCYGLGSLDPSTGHRGVIALPESVHPAIRSTFDRYTHVKAPNGKPIHVLAQPAWTLDQIVRVRNVLTHLLAPVAGSRYGSDKTAVANAMANRRATMALFEDEPAMERAFRSRFGRLRLGVQDLRANECPVEGTPDYMRHETRDAAFEEILHLVHDYGIRPALPDYDRLIQRRNDEAAEKGIWDPWPEDEPDSHRNEYIAAVYDNYLDLWTLPPTRYEGERIPADEIPKGTSHFGTYRAGSRALLSTIDPNAAAMIEAFLPDHVTYTAELPDAFDGTFQLQLDPAHRYTTASQHLRNVKLRGRNGANLVGNDANNRLLGNAGPNELTGSGGDDLLDGGAGRDTAILRGVRAEYDVRRNDDVVVIRDRIEGRDGTDELRSIEAIRFRDVTVDAADVR